MHAAGKPMGFMCIAPVLAARVLGPFHPRLTIGNDAGTAAALEAMGAKHEIAAVEGAVVCEVTRVVTTPAYMLGPTISRIAVGIEALVAEVLRMVR
jgi:enhancing lycopene biosynthesis protein 2